MIHDLPFDGPKLITPKRHLDGRGFFCEMHNPAKLKAAGFAHNFVQDNHAFSERKGTLRGLHFQKPPHAQGKLVMVLSGAVRDVIVDLREGSETFRQMILVDLSAEDSTQLWVPEGFAHGYVTTKPNTHVLYKVTAPYAPDAEGGLAYDDPALGIDWGFRESQLIISEKDRAWPGLDDLEVWPFPKDAA